MGAVSRYFVVVCLRHRMAGAIGGASLAVLGASLAATWLTPGTERRSFFDAAYLGLELLAVLSPLMASAVLHVLEFEQRSAWLVMARPVSRPGYAWGRLAGITAVSWAGTLIMGAGVVAVAAVGGSISEPWLVPVLVSCVLVAPVSGAVCCLVSFVSTSYVTAGLVSLGVVVLGWMSPSLPLLAQRASHPVISLLLTGIYWILPHLGDFSVRDMTAPPEAWYLWLLGIYAIGYTALAGLAASAVLGRREI
jgi:ABC-type transport system involved in multi-copper enzyme maturation permease subunit